MTTLIRRYVPNPPLSEVVSMFWLYEGSSRPHAMERLLPTGTMELVINLREDESRIYDRENTSRHQTLPGALVCGAHSEYFVLDTACQQAVIGVHFKPGGAFPFFKLPVSELRNSHVSLETLWHGLAGELRERVLAAPTPEAKFHVLEQVLLAAATRPLVHHPVVAFALNQLPHARTVSDVTDRIGLSRRRFIQLFDEEVGLTPKLYSRVLRFQQVLHLVQNQRQVDWVEVALACGYFDQAHFIHDFRSFSGLNPTAYLTVRGEFLNHVPITD